jgi:hypothetical protein
MKIKLLLILFFLSMNVHANDSLLSECLTLASPYNASMPMRVDSETTMISVGCKEVKGRTTLFYYSKVDFPRSQYKPISTIKNSKVNFVCTKPSMRELVRYLNIEYAYYDSSNLYIGSITIKNDDCN